MISGTPVSGETISGAPLTVASTGISGTLTATLGALVLVCTGTLALAGQATPTLGACTLVATGSSGGGVGVVAATLAPVTCSAAGALALTGQATPTLAPVTSVASGALSVTGSLAGTLAPVTLVARGLVTNGPPVDLPLIDPDHADPSWAHYRPVTPSDSVDIRLTSRRLTDAVYVGVAGDVAAVQQNGVAVVFTAVPAGAILPVQARRVNATGTTASGLVALYV